MQGYHIRFSQIWKPAGQRHSVRARAMQAIRTQTPLAI